MAPVVPLDYGDFRSNHLCASLRKIKLAGKIYGSRNRRGLERWAATARDLRGVRTVS